MAYAICIEIPEIPSELNVRFPGLGTLAALRDSLEKMPRPSEIVLKFINSLQPAMGSLYMFIRVIDVVIAVINCIKAIPEAIPFNPGAIINCLTNLFEKLAALLKLLPPLVYVAFIADILQLLRILVADIISLILLIDQRITEIKQMITEAQTRGDTVLIQLGECAKQETIREAEGLLQIFQIVGKLMLLFLTVLDAMATLIPGLSDKITKMKKDIESFNRTATGTSITDFPPLGAFLTMCNTSYNILTYLEQLLRAVLAEPLTFSALPVPHLVNT